MEIAYDSAGLLKLQNQLYTRSTIVGQADYKKYGKMPVKPYSAYGRTIDTYYVGGKRAPEKGDNGNSSQAVVLKVYGKVKQVIAKEEWFMLDFFKLNGFDLDAGVDRCELTIKGRLLRGVINDFEMLYDTSVLFAIFKRFGRNHLKWYDLRDYKYVNGNRVYSTVELIDFNNYPIAPLEFDKVPVMSNKGLKTLKTMITTLYGIYIRQDSKVIHDTIFHLMRKHPELQRWVLDKYRFFEVDYSLPYEEGYKKRAMSIQLEFYKIKDGFRKC